LNIRKEIVTKIYTLFIVIDKQVKLRLVFVELLKTTNYFLDFSSQRKHCNTH